MVQSLVKTALSFALFAICVQCALLPYSPHTEMAKDVDAHVYKKPLSTLKAELIAALPTLYSANAPTIFIYNKGGGMYVHAGPDPKPQWDKGFTYKGRFYETAPTSLDLADLLKLDTASIWTDKVKNAFSNGSYHVLEDTDTSFMIVKSNDVFIGKAVADGSTLEVYTVPKFHRGPLRVAIDLDPTTKSSLNWWEFVRLKNDPIVFETSFKDFGKKAPARALAALYVLDSEYAKTRESELRAAHVKAIEKNSLL